MPERKQPNLLYIHSDQHSPFVTGCYGDPLVQTPNLDRLAASGALFENCYCTSPICVPSRMSMLTGQHPYQHETWTNSDALNASIPTFAHAMGVVGYHPVLIGRMHAVGPDQLHGYVDRLIGDHGSNYVGGGGVDHGVLSGTSGPQRVSLKRSGSGQSAYQVHDEYVTMATVDYFNCLGVLKKTEGLTDPFSLTVGFMLPHPPYVARSEDYDLYQDMMTLPTKRESSSSDTHPYLHWWRQHTGIEAVSEQEILRARTAYWALVTRLDAMIGQILSALDTNDLADNTLIVYTSDHGDMLGEHGLWWKHTFYEESAKVPLIVSWPGVIPAGRRCDRVVSAVDVTATMLDALDAPPLPNAVGKSLLGLVAEEGNWRETHVEWEDVAFSEYCTDREGPRDGCYQRMVRQGDWKLIYYHDHEPQLFNLADDPDELVDLARDPAFVEIRKDLVARVLDDWNPEQIAEKMAAKREDRKILAAWARHTKPQDQFRWTLKPEMDYLDECQHTISQDESS